MLFLLSEAQQKNAIVNPPPKFGNDCQQHARPRACPSNFFEQFYIQLYIQFNNCIIVRFSSFAQPQSKCLLLFSIQVLPFWKIVLHMWPLCNKNYLPLLPQNIAINFENFRNSYWRGVVYIFIWYNMLFCRGIMKQYNVFDVGFTGYQVVINKTLVTTL
jgi:hypothetical protein